MPRPDGRLPNQIRPFAATPGALSRADGSSRFSHERTELLASVYGPCEARRARELSHTAAVEVLFRPRGGLPGPREREAEALLCRAVEYAALGALHPRTALSLVLQVVHDDGALLSAALHAACVALLHAGVPLRGMLAGCTIAILHDGEMVLDPTAQEELEARTVVSLGYMFRTCYQYDEGDEGAEGEEGGGNGDEWEPPKHTIERELLLSHVRGVLSQEEYALCLHAAQQAGICVSAFCRQVMERSTNCEAKLPSGRVTRDQDEAITQLLKESMDTSA